MGDFKFEMPIWIPLWICQIGSWIYESRVRWKGIHCRKCKYEKFQHIYGIKTMNLDEIPHKKV